MLREGANGEVLELKNDSSVPESIDNVFNAFLERNQCSFLSRRTEFEGAIVINSPWGENSIALLVPDEPEKLAVHLEHVYLPPRLSAILHTDTSQLEIIWHAFKIPAAIKDIEERNFTFRYNGVDYRCKFSESSERLIAIANHYAPVGASETSYRNLVSFKRYLTEKNKDVKNALFGKPYSFFIEPINLNDDEMIEILNNLNFYLSYYDNKSPIVLIHPPSTTPTTNEKRIRYRHGDFPKAINARDIDPMLLQFWSACMQADSSQRFLNAYRIIEHSAFYFVEQAPKQAVRKALSTPHALNDLDKITQEVIAAIQKSKYDDYTKFEAVVAQCVDPELLWQEIESNIDYFSKEILFDGDYRAPALVAGSGSKSDFMHNGIKNFCQTARRIRNALSHGKEERSAAVITPTSSNYEKLGRWSRLVQVAAGEVILYNGL